MHCGSMCPPKHLRNPCAVDRAVLRSSRAKARRRQDAGCCRCGGVELAHQVDLGCGLHRGEGSEHGLFETTRFDPGSRGRCCRPRLGVRRSRGRCLRGRWPRPRPSPARPTQSPTLARRRTDPHREGQPCTGPCVPRGLGPSRRAGSPAREPPRRGPVLLWKAVSLRASPARRSRRRHQGPGMLPVMSQPERPDRLGRARPVKPLGLRPLVARPVAVQTERLRGARPSAWLGRQAPG